MSVLILLLARFGNNGVSIPMAEHSDGIIFGILVVYGYALIMSVVVVSLIAKEKTPTVMVSSCAIESIDSCTYCTYANGLSFQSSLFTVVGLIFYLIAGIRCIAVHHDSPFKYDEGILLGSALIIQSIFFFFDVVFAVVSRMRNKKT